LGEIKISITIGNEDGKLLGMIKVIVDEEFVRQQAREMAGNIKHHTFEHMKLMIEEALQHQLDETQRRLVVDYFVEEFLRKTNHIINEVYEDAKKYLEERVADRL